MSFESPPDIDYSVGAVVRVGNVTRSAPVLYSKSEQLNVGRH